jgi:hypothetical protein
MLRIISARRGRIWRLELHGTIAGEWIELLDRHWRGIVRATASAIVRVNLSNVSFVSSEGEILLQRMAQHGVHFEGAGLMTRYVIEKISGRR